MTKIAEEKRIVEVMVRLYCRRKEKNGQLCAECIELLEYAFARLDRCPYSECKKSCKECSTHCYKPAMREKIRQVMRFSGPRMILFEPWETIRHWIKL